MILYKKRCITKVTDFRWHGFFSIYADNILNHIKMMSYA